MEPIESIKIQHLWQLYNARLERSLHLNMRLLETIEGDKVKASFAAVVRYKIFAVVLGVCWNIFLGNLLYVYHTEPFFVVSVVLIMLFGIVAITSYIYQIILIRKLDLSDPVIETQRKLATLQASIIRTLRVQFLQAPLYCVFFITVRMIKNAGPLFWTIEIIVTGIFVWFSIWLFRNVSTLNKDKRWVKTLIKGEGGASIAKAVQFIREIDVFKNEWSEEDMKY